MMILFIETSFTKKISLKWGFILLVAYVISLVVTDIPFAIASIIMVFAVGGIMSGWERKYLPVLAQLALLTGFGAEFVFTKVFTIPLP